MKKVIGIYCGDFAHYNWDSYYVRKNGTGGSETWAVELASAFYRLGFHVIVFGEPDFWKFDDEGVEYVPYQMFEHRCSYQHFDYFISSRRADEITPYLECPNIYIMSHEIGVFNGYWGNFSDYEGLKMDKVKKICVLSEWHKNETKKIYPKLTDDQLFINFNGIDRTLYQKIDYNLKKNKMVWSTCLNRGLTFFGEWVLPKILKEIPDFELDICSYNTDIHGVIPEGNNIHFLGSLDKKSLAELQKTAKVWVLPNYGLNDFGEPLHESFCITAVENALAGNAIVCFNKDGLTTTLKGYSGILNADFFDEYNDEFNDSVKERLSNMLAHQVCSIIKYQSMWYDLVKEEQEICRKYTWDNVAKEWLKEWGLIYGK